MDKNYLTGFLNGIIEGIEQPIVIPPDTDKYIHQAAVLEVRMAEVLRSLKKLRKVNYATTNNR